MNNQTRTLAEVQALSSRIAAVNEIAVAINGSLRLDDVLGVVRKQAKWLLDFEHCSICLKDAKVDWRFEVLFGEDVDFDVSYILESGPLARALDSGQPQIGQGEAGHFLAGFDSQLIVPLVMQKQVLGAIAFAAKSAKRYTQEDVRIGYLLALQVAAAVNNARNFEELERLYREVEVQKHVAETANQAKSSFLANMSHELRTPLNSVISISDILLEKYFGDLTAEQEEYVQDLKNSGQHLLSLINDILDLSKVEAGYSPLEPASVDLGELIADSLSIVRERALKHGIELSCQVAEELPLVICDARKIKQVVFNLLSNAVKFTPDGGKVGVDITQKEDGVCVCVWDTGIGIAEDQQNMIFDEFVQTDASLTRKHEGTGLGLALVKRFVEQHGGQVWLVSQLNEGSRFSFSLPFELCEP